MKTRLILGLLLLAGCKKKDTCKPDQIEWQVRLALGAGETINPNGEGTALPTALRIYQLRGDISADELDFETVWAAEKAEDLGEAFLAVEELTVYPNQVDLRGLPVEKEATHMVATGLFREPAGNTWWTIFEIPRLHPQVVCSKAPVTHRYPDPCFFVYLDRNALSGGPVPPPGFVPDASVECAPVGVVPDPPDKKKRRRRRWNEQPDELDDPLKTREVDQKVPRTPQTPQTPQPQTPQTPQTPQMPQTPQTPQTPKAPTAPTLPGK